MASYTVSVERKALKALGQIAVRPRQRIIRAIDALAVAPRPEGCKTLDSRKKVYRIRVGDYRVVYQVRDAELRVLVVALGNRREVYRQIREMISRLE
jgi:mRNA interferase RelE/StbE